MAYGKGNMGSAGNIKQVYSGISVIAGSSYSSQINITIPAVDDVNESMVEVEYFNGFPNAEDAQFAYELTSPTNIRIFHTTSAGSSDMVISWRVTQFRNVKQKITGSYSITSSLVDQNIAIPSINTNKYILKIGTTSTASGDILLTRTNATARITNSTTLTVRGYDVIDVYYQILEFY